MSIIKIEKHDYTVEPLTQWDRNQTLEIYGLSLARAPEVHFSNIAMDRAITRQATMDSKGVITVSVPNGLLQKPYTITAHLCQYNGATFETLYTVKIPVTERKQPADYTIEDDGDLYSFNALNNKVDQAVADMKAAEQSMTDNLGPLVENKVGDAVAALIDTTLSQTGKAADAKAVTDAIAAAVNSIRASISGTVLWEGSQQSGKIELDLTPYKRVRIIWRRSDADGAGGYISRHIETTATRGDHIVHFNESNSYKVYNVADDGIDVYVGGANASSVRAAVIIGYDF